LISVKKQTQDYRGVNVTNLTSSWKNGLALCALIHRQRPDLIDFDSLNEEDMAENNQLAFDVAEREFGIQPVTRGKEMAAEAEPDKLLMVLYLSKFYETFRNTTGNNNGKVSSCFSVKTEFKCSISSRPTHKMTGPLKDSWMSFNNIHRCVLDQQR
uniref:Calponin-homology (CH) domain-containing protein n=1 Tax=Labrus bergylta TaxID=56723 RepID=A0A3Q3GVW6_9LABR